jgi:hypothetical protein
MSFGCPSRRARWPSARAVISASGRAVMRLWRAVTAASGGLRPPTGRAADLELSQMGRAGRRLGATHVAVVLACGLIRALVGLRLGPTPAPHVTVAVRCGQGDTGLRPRAAGLTPMRGRVPLLRTVARTLVVPGDDETELDGRRGFEHPTQVLERRRLQGVQAHDDDDRVDVGAQRDRMAA